MNAQECAEGDQRGGGGGPPQASRATDLALRDDRWLGFQCDLRYQILAGETESGLGNGMAIRQAQAGNAVPGPDDDRKTDIVMMDDFLYGEPTPFLRRHTFWGKER